MQSTLMYREAEEAPARVADALRRNATAIADLAARIRRNEPRAVVTCARGSSDHAATYLRYLVERELGLLTSSAAPSISSLYRANLRLENCLCLAISQSGASPDLLSVVRRARDGGAWTVALVNREDSPLAELAHETLPLGAGEERSVAATKSFIASAASALQLVAAWRGDARLQAAVDALPDTLAEAWELDWSPALPLLANKQSLYVVARGVGLGIAQEAALKFKEVCGLHAEALSAAELLHGPIEIVTGDFPVLLLGQDDETRDGVEDLARELAARGVPLLAAGIRGAGIELPTVAADSRVQPLAQVQAFYRLANALAIERGRDPDRPVRLRKVTTTV